MKTILFVDDNRDILEIYTEFLSINYNVISVDNTKDALVKIKSQEFDLLLSDYDIDEMNGLELCEIFKNAQDKPTIIFTGTCNTQDITSSKFVNDLAIKPLPPKTLIGKLVKLIGE